MATRYTQKAPTSHRKGVDQSYIHDANVINGF